MSSVYSMEQAKQQIYNYVEGVDGETHISFIPSSHHRYIQGGLLKKILPELEKEEFTPLEHLALSLLTLHLLSLDIITLRKGK